MTKGKTYTLTFTFESRYGETQEEDIKLLEQKLIHYGNMIATENNGSNKHLGLHFTVIEVQTSRLLS